MGPDRALNRRLVRFLVGITSLFFVSTVALLAAWVFLPRLTLGWTPAAITSGSMAPLINRGDVVLAELDDGGGLSLGDVVTFEDPSRSGYVTHRIDGLAPDGGYFTKGDANADPDSTSLRPENVVGKARLLVPFIGHPFVWYLDGAWLELMLTGALLGVAVWCARWAFVFDPWKPAVDSGQLETPVSRKRHPVGALRSLWVVGLLSLAMVGLPGASAANFSAQASNGTNALAGSTWFAAETFRVATYEIGDGVFTGTTYTLTLDQDLAADYFVILRGAAGANDIGTQRAPDQNYARVDGDPHSNFATVTAADQLRLSRQGASSAWQGQVTVVETTPDQTASGFTLLDVVEVSLASGVATGSGTSTTAWSDINQVGLYGGIRGGGVATTSTDRNDHMTTWARIYPSSTTTLNLERVAGGGGALSGDTTFTIYVVEWGAEWTIQRASISGTAGGNGANLVGHYDTASIAPVPRDITFVLAYGINTDNGLGNGWEGQVFTLGDGVNQLAVESVVAVGGEYTATRSAEVYVHTHPSLAVDYRFGSDGGTPGIPNGSLSGTVGIDAAGGAETYDTASAIRKTSGFRFTVVANTQNGTGTAYPRTMVWSRPTDLTTATWTRSRTAQPGAFWLQAVDFAGISR